MAFICDPPSLAPKYLGLHMCTTTPGIKMKTSKVTNVKGIYYLQRPRVNVTYEFSAATKTID
jgi:hypothetical protein